MAQRILIVDDASEMVQFLEAMLAREGYEVATANDAREGLRLAYSFRPDLVLLDVMMPDLDGWAMLGRLREFSDIPVILVTVLDGTDNIVQGLHSGADDYVTKPFKMNELKARVRAILRRASLSAEDGQKPLSFDGSRLVIDPSSHQVTVEGKAVRLTPTEYKLLLVLAHNAGQVLTCEQILDLVWGPGYKDSPANVKVHIQHLRRKVEANPHQPRCIRTQWGVGYYLAKN
jgi:two-component system KDP operon response regulator KdpE